jgi:dihydroxyacid dehydratase/phosphogluconate dehydratase
VIVLVGRGPMGAGMEETYQVTSALRYLPFGKHVALLTDARFSGVSTGACVGHISPEALAGGPIGRLRDGDLIEIVVDRRTLEGSIDFVGGAAGRVPAGDAAHILARREPHPDLAPDPALPDDTRIWAALQDASGGTWGGAVFDADAILRVMAAGKRALNDSR